MERIAIVGPGGAGKSTLARRLGAALDLPVVHLDEHFWQPGWTETPRDEWRDRQARLLAGDRWIADGNYGSTLEVRFARAETVIRLEPGRMRCVLGALSRAVKHRGQTVQARGCPERLDLDFLRWIWNYPRDSRGRVDAAIARHRHITVIELRSRRAAERLVDGFDSDRLDSGGGVAS